MLRSSLQFLFLVAIVVPSFGLQLGPHQRRICGPRHSTITDTNNAASNLAISRLGFGQQVAQQIIMVAGIGISTASMPSPSLAKETAQDLDDVGKLKKGYERLNYLLDNWEKLTTVCGKTDNPYQGTNGCERSPLLVMDYMGYKSMNDPLFKADKTMKRLSAKVPSEDSVDYLEAMEKWGEAAEEASGMAYISSWGEANPGGGKDRVEYWIERSRKNVTDARDSLETALRILGQL
mmetsp:Transcript_25637/g.48553  ORF Transcript_25637/g.48553 Transcript_25637/m.48553 type:complete len:235 (+) Transcript_25637:170-874(+)